MTVPSDTDIKILEQATHNAGFRDYSIKKKPASMMSYSRKALSSNPYLIVKNRRSNRIIQIIWVDDITAVAKEIICKIEEYEAKTDFSKIDLSPR